MDVFPPAPGELTAAHSPQHSAARSTGSPWVRSVLLADYPHDLTGHEEALLFGLVVATALTILGDPPQARRLQLIRTIAERSVAALEDHDAW